MKMYVVLWEGVRVAKMIGCPFCDQRFALPVYYGLAEAARWLQDNHLPTHADEIEAASSEIPAAEMCARCQRYAGSIGPDDVLHRRCFDVNCHCPCSRYTAAKEAE